MTRPEQVTVRNSYGVFIVDGSYEPFVKGIVNALPENCTPDEGGCFDSYSIFKVSDDGKTEIEVSDIMDEAIRVEILDEAARLAEEEGNGA